MPLVYRIQKAAFVATLLQGEGARLFGGRWNPVGVPLVYTSTTPELALLEVLVHADGTPLRDLPPLVQVTLDVPDELVENVSIDQLPVGWQQVPAPTELPYFLLPRLQPSYPALAFAVPSVVLKTSPSRNLLLNPVHPQIGRVTVQTVVPHVFDERL
ncbi:RES family NAD+ phosphorylase [uncultured Hymenobacter sp.]|uniref:RES family NAD+ phosphorylase n=1 Tax=uncultured Hymenobacter sp. TaxID=170016 RepID=UPI0035CB3B1C